MVLPLRRNQSDSSESKIGSRWSGAAGGGTITLPGSVFGSRPSLPRTLVAAGPPALGPSPSWTFWMPIGDWETFPPKAGSLLGPGPGPPGSADTAGSRGIVRSAPSSGSSLAGVVLPLPFALRTGSDWAESLPSQPFPAAGPEPGAPGVSAPGVLAPDVPAPAAGVKEGDGGTDG